MCRDRSHFLNVYSWEVHVCIHVCGCVHVCVPVRMHVNVRSNLPYLNVFGLFILVYVHECFACTSVCELNTCALLGEAKRRSLEPLKVELEMVLSHHMGAENETQDSLNH